MQFYPISGTFHFLKHYIFFLFWWSPIYLFIFCFSFWYPNPRSQKRILCFLLWIIIWWIIALVLRYVLCIYVLSPENKFCIWWLTVLRASVLWGQRLPNLYFACGHLLFLHTYTTCLILDYININLACMRAVSCPCRDSSSVSTMRRRHALCGQSLTSGHLYVTLCRLKHMVKAVSQKGNSWWGLYHCQRQVLLSCVCNSLCTQ